jgi:hypothetical protein
MVSLLLVVVGIADPTLLMPRPQVMPSSTAQELVDGTRLIGVVEQVVSGVTVLRRATGDRRQVDASQVVSAHTATSATPSSTSETRVPWREHVSRTRPRARGGAYRRPQSLLAVRAERSGRL